MCFSNKHGGPRYKPKLPRKQPGWGSPAWPKSRRKFSLTLLLVALPACIFQSKHPHARAKKYYGRQARQMKRFKGRGGRRWEFTRTAWYGELRYGGLRDWFNWVFLSLDEHEESCRWRRFAYAVTRRQ